MEDADKATVQLWLDRYNRWDSFAKPYKDKWERYYNAYRCYTKKRSDGLSNIYVPFIFSMVETILPRLVEAHFGTKPWVGVLPGGPEDVPGADAQEQIIQFQMEERMDFMQKATDWLKECLIYGTSIGMVTWRLEQEIRKRLQKNSLNFFGVQVPLSGYSPVEQRIITYDDNEFTHIDLESCFFEPRAKDIKSALYAGHITYENWAYLKLMEGQGFYKNLADVEKTSNSEQSPIFKRLNKIGLGGDISDAGSDKDGQIHELMHCFKNGEYVVIANRQTVIRQGPNPYYHNRKPYVRITDIPIPNEFYGMGEVETAEYLQYAKNDLDNAKIDYIMMSILGVFLLDKDSELTDDDLKLHARKVLRMQNLEELKPWVMPSLDPAAFSIDAELDRQMANSTGAQDTVRGQMPNKNATAFEVSTVQQMAEARFRLKVRLINQSGIREVARLMALNNQQFITQDKAIRILGPVKGQFEFPTFTPEMLQGEFDFIPAGVAEEPLVSKEARRQGLNELYKMWQGNQRVKEEALMRKQAEAYDIEDPSEVVKSDEDIMREQQMAAQAQMQAMAPAEPVPGEIPPEMAAMMNANGV